MAQRLKTPAELAEIERRRKETRAAVPDPTVRLMREIGSVRVRRIIRARFPRSRRPSAFVFLKRSLMLHSQARSLPTTEAP